MNKLLLAGLLVGSACLPLWSAEPSKDKKKASPPQASTAPATVAAPPKAIPIPAPAPGKVPGTPERKLEAYLLLPEPRSMRSANSIVVGGAKNTVFSPARETSGAAGVELYTEAEFAKLGIGKDAFEKRARQGAERLLGVYRPELVTDAAGKVRYAVYRGEKQVFACLLVAPSLARVFEQTFGKEILVAVPDRQSLYVFPADPAAVDDVAADLDFRFETGAYAASNEVFVVKLDGSPIVTLGTFSSK